MGMFRQKRKWWDGLTPEERAEWGTLDLEAAQIKLARINLPEHLHIAIARRAAATRRQSERVIRLTLLVAVITLILTGIGVAVAFHWIGG